MQRRDFIKISALTGATAALDGCGNPEHQLIRFVPEEDWVPGIAEWRRSVCALCPAGCGLLVRVMQGDAEVIRGGKRGVIQMGLAKKLEGNPNHPINQGKLCPRGQAGLQVTYHPDRLKNPMRRSGPRGSGEFHEVSWDDAIQELGSRLAGLISNPESSALAFLTKPWRGQRRELIERFAGAFGASPLTYEPLDENVLRRANALSFGRAQLPTLELARANYVLSFGADFLGAWNSPVAQAIGYGAMRQGRPGTRAKFVMIESRMSQTGANADEWLPARPGTEGALALGLAHVILNEKLKSQETAGRAGLLIAGWPQGLPDYAPERTEKITGVAAATVTRLGRELASHEPAVALIGGAPLAHSNGLFNALAVNALNALLGSVGKPGGVFFTPYPTPVATKSASAKPAKKESPANLGALIRQIQRDAGSPKVLLLDEANPVFAAPGSLGVREALAKIPFIASFGAFVDETSALADLILPDHSPLESWVDDVPESGAVTAVASLASPALRPLHNTRATPDVLLEVAHRLGGAASAALPWKTFDEMLKSAFLGLRHEKGSISSTDPEDFWKQVQEQGGWWASESKTSGTDVEPPQAQPPRAFVEPQFAGEEKDFPFYFLPFASPMFYDGSLAHLPWMQETPDPLSTAMWSAWVEINPKTAKRLNIQDGDLLEVASEHGKLRAPALIYPGIAPEVVAMPVGQGHENFTRYASQRGANPFSILAPAKEPETGSLAWADTRVKITRVGEGKLTLFAGGMSRFPAAQERR